MNRLLFYLVMAFTLALPFVACTTDDEQDTDSGMTNNGGAGNDSDSIAGNDSIANPDTIAGNDSIAAPDTIIGGDSTTTWNPDSTVFHCRRSDGKQIYGMLYANLAASSLRPAVILAHSASLTHEAMAGYARRLSQKGMVAYCFDFCGGSKDSKSDGATDSMTVFTEVEDLRAVVKTIRQQGFVDKDHVYLLGSSQGGLVSALLAEEMPDELAGMVLFYPAFNIPEMVKQFSGWGNMGNWGDFGGMMSMSEAYISSIRDFDVWTHIGTFPHPVCIVHGTSDIIVPISNSKKAAGLYPNATLHKIEGANHGFNAANYGSMGSSMGMKDYDDVVMPIVYDFLGCR